MRKQNKDEKGITLVALIITIIILLILAVISIAQLTENGLFLKTKQAEKENLKEVLKEELNLKLMDYKMLTVVNGKIINLENLKKYFNNDEDVKVLDNSYEIEYIEIFYKGYLFRIDKNINILDYFEEGKMEIITKSGEEGKNGWYLSDVNLKIDVTSYKEQVKKMVYNINNGEDKQVNSNILNITITDNGTNTIKYKLLDDNLNVVKENSVEVKINKNKPSAIIEISSFEEDYKEQIPVTITIQEDNISGIDNENCVWFLNNSNEKIGNDKSAYKGGNIANIENLSVQNPGTYYLHCLITNNAGNYEEYISDPIKFIKITKLLNGADTHDDITGGWDFAKSRAGGFYYRK